MRMGRDSKNNYKFGIGAFIVTDTNQTENTVIRGWGLMKYKRASNAWGGRASRDLLEKLQQLLASERQELPQFWKDELNELKSIQAAVDRERVRKTVVEAVHYPVKRRLYEHQKRGANMALLALGILTPEEVEKAYETENRNKAEIQQ